MTICVMSNFHQLTLKPVYINNTSIKSHLTPSYQDSSILTLLYYNDNLFKISNFGHLRKAPLCSASPWSGVVGHLPFSEKFGQHWKCLDTP
jgi:hypothetical protein